MQLHAPPIAVDHADNLHKIDVHLGDSQARVKGCDH